MHFHNKYLLPTRIVAHEGVERVERLLDDEPLQAIPVDHRSAPDGYATIKQGGYVLLDFGREIRGGIAFCVRSISSGLKNARCRVVFGESVMEALSSIGHKNATNDHAIRDTVLDIPTMGNVHFGNTGFRFFKLEALDVDVVIKSVKAELDMRDIEYKGSFECSDERLNEIWRVGAYTVELNMGEYIWDGIKRDRLIWLGDMHPETSVVYSVFGNDESIRRSLDCSKIDYPATTWMNCIPSYSFWWVINQYDWYMHTGDLDYLRAQEDYVTTVTDRALEIVTADPRENFSFFVDWSARADQDASRVGFYAVMYKMYDCVARIADLLGRTELRAKAESGIAKIRALELTIPNQKQMAGIAVFSGLADAKKTNEKILAVDELKGLSTFMGYYVLLARGATGDTAGALNVIRSFWGAMLDLGATSFWEDFDIDWVENSARIDEIVPEGRNDVHGDFGKFCYKQFRHSLCHGWAGGPTAFLSQYVLGVNVAEAGCKKLVIKPNLCDLEWVRGSFPTPYGSVQISHRRAENRIITEIFAPDEVEIEVID